MIWWGGKCNTLWELKQLWEHSSHRLRFVHTEPEVWVCHSVCSSLMLRNHLLFWKQSHTLPLQRLPGQGSRLPIVSGTLSDIRSIPATRSQGSRAPRHGLEPSQTRHWYYTAPPFYVLEIFFFFFKLLKSGSFFVLFLSICVSFQFFFFNLAVVGKSRAWSTPTSITEASPSSLRSWPGWRK